MQIGVMGMGLMGQPIAHRLIQNGHPVGVYNRTLDKAKPLEEAGAKVFSTPQALVAASEVLLLTLADAIAIEAVLLTPEVRSCLAGKTVIQMGTIAPAESQSLCDQVIACGGSYLEAPVLGSIPEAKAGTLLVMVGSTPEQFEAWRSLLDQLGQNPRLIGPAGTAAALKLALNQLIGSLTSAFAVSLAFTQRHQVPTDSFMDILRDSALYAPTFDKKLTRMLEQNFANPNFPTKHLLKDMRLFETAADAVQINTAITQAICGVIESVMEPYRDADYSALSTGMGL